MEEIFIRFPDLSKDIFKLLFKENLAKCKKVSKSWYEYLHIGRTVLHEAAYMGNLDFLKVEIKGIAGSLIA